MIYYKAETFIFKCVWKKQMSSEKNVSLFETLSALQKRKRNRYLSKPYLLNFICLCSVFSIWIIPWLGILYSSGRHYKTQKIQLSFAFCIQPCQWNWERFWAKFCDPQANVLHSCLFWSFHIFKLKINKQQVLIFVSDNVWLVCTLMFSLLLAERRAWVW